MTEDKVAEEILPKSGIQKKIKSDHSCQLSCGGSSELNSNPNKLVVI
ncbi:MAG: hypothetical protein ACFFBL_09935 [Promethearchaeota archaeon]